MPKITHQHKNRKTVISIVEVNVPVAATPGIIAAAGGAISNPLIRLLHELSNVKLNFFKYIDINHNH